jgi:hypothetical protein
VIAALPAFIAGTGCYRYEPTTLEMVHPGERVSVTLVPSDAPALAPILGPDAASVQGRLTALAPADMTIALTQIARGSGPEQFLNDQPVTLPRRSAASIAVRRLDRPRSHHAAVSIAAAIVAGQVFINQAGINGGRSGPPGSPK